MNSENIKEDISGTGIFDGGFVTRPDPSYAPPPTVNTNVNTNEALQGTVEVVGNSLNDLYKEATNFFPARIAISVVLVVAVIIGIFKIL